MCCKGRLCIGQVEEWVCLATVLSGIDSILSQALQRSGLVRMSHDEAGRKHFDWCLILAWEISNNSEMSLRTPVVYCGDQILSWQRACKCPCGSVVVSHHLPWFSPNNS